MRYFVVEPHSDDAFISLGGHILKWRAEGHSVHIVTVYAAETRRAEEAKAYADAVGAEWTGFDIQQGEPVPSPSVWPFIFTADSRLVLPVGIQHPDHIRVAACWPWPDLEWAADNSVFALRYLEIPYYVKQKNCEEVNSKLKSGLARFESILRAPATKFNRASIFRSQAKFFHFNDPKKLVQIPEIILS